MTGYPIAEQKAFKLTKKVYAYNHHKSMLVRMTARSTNEDDYSTSYLIHGIRLNSARPFLLF